MSSVILHEEEEYDYEEILDRIEKEMEIDDEDYLKMSKEERIRLFGDFQKRPVTYKQQTDLLPELVKTANARLTGEPTKPTPTPPPISPPVITKIFSMKGVNIPSSNIIQNVKGRYIHSENKRFVKVIYPNDKANVE